MDALPPEFLILIVALVSALAGGLLVWVACYVAGGGKGGRQHRQPPVVAAQADQEAPASPGEQDLLRVSRMKKGGLAVVVQGQRYRHLREITDPQVGDETIEALKAVLAFAEGWLPSTSQTPPQPASQKSVMVDEQTFLRQLRQRALFSPDRPSGLMGWQRRHPSPRPLEPLLTPAEEIDELVQQRLRRQPDLSGHYIRLTTGKDGSLRIQVDQQTFDAVDDIPDIRVRALIQDAVREWESQ
ncbi:MAG: hypothetical protein DRI79_11640 [Chloroflexi bacterium]|nr:MAG: hypothetical protein DRI80_14740 [Chloroflexota bacterium]RLC85244.1 MAG: hypothetical protein DRI79_11640 [Chloroflexota bacterium]HEY68014.1 hypothetical protein [Thermoflexia bacterium]